MAPARKVPKLHKKPLAVKKGTKFVDIQRQEFSVGKEIGQGGFGRIYDGVQTGSRQPVAIKMEPQANGPLFTEMHVYMRVLKSDHLEKWKREKGLKFLGLPHYISSGSFSYENEEIRYLVIPKYALSLESIREARSGETLTLAETHAVAKTVLYSLAYLHDQNYVHGDVKAGNLMMDNASDFSRVFLIDFGLARKLPDALVEKENKKQAHNGTPLFTSCDAHRGCLPSFRGDLEILAHNMLYWLTGSLPWKPFEDDLERVYQAKKALIGNARKEVVKLMPKDRKGAAMVSELYMTAAGMDFAERLDLAKLVQIVGA